MRLVQYGQGIAYTIVNGRVVMKDGKPATDDLPGRTIRSTHYAG